MAEEDRAELTEKKPLVVAPVGNRASRKERAATERNAARTIEAKRKDERLLSKHLCLPADTDEILLEQIVGPNDALEPGEDFP